MRLEGDGAEASSLPQLKIWKEGNSPSVDKTIPDGKGGAEGSGVSAEIIFLRVMENVRSPGAEWSGDFYERKDIFMDWMFVVLLSPLYPALYFSLYPNLITLGASS